MERNIIIRVGDNTHIGGLVEDIEYLSAKTEDSFDFEQILNTAVQLLYSAQPGGKQHYSGEHADIGDVWLSGANNRQGHGHVNIEYNPSGLMKKVLTFTQATIATIDLRKKIYSVRWDSNHKRNDLHLPSVLMKDTEKVMNSLGLKRGQFKYYTQK